MRARFVLTVVCIATALFFRCATMVHGQQVYFSDTAETRESIQAGNMYVRARMEAISHLLDQSDNIQDEVLRKAEKKERHLAGMLVEKQPELYTEYARQTLTFDSIRRLSKDTSTLYNKGSPKSTGLIDSLKGIQRFIQHQSARLSTASGLGEKAGLPAEYAQKLNQLQQRIQAQQQISQLIDQRESSLQNLLAGKEIPALGSIQKDIAIARSKIQCWKAVADDPGKAEEKALEYLQGTEGFQSYLHPNNNAFGGLAGNATAADLQRLGYQTKGQVNNMLQQKFGDRLGDIRQQMGDQIAQYQEKLNSVREKADQAKSSVTQAKQTLAEARQSGNRLRHIEKPAFSNPMRGVPFRQRLETRYDFQSSRSIDSRPAMLNLGASLAYKQTPKLKTGIGISTDIGMGKDWQHLELSYEGISLRGFINYDMIYGIAVEGGYERIFRPQNRAYPDPTPEQRMQQEVNNDMFSEVFGGQQQALYLGLMKSYRVNKKWNGTFMIGYNFLWQQYNLKSPLLIRLGWQK